jgi:hypothetical protein
MESVKPNHYKVTIIGLSLEQFTALRYFRKKGGTEKQINDTEKAIQCLELHKKTLINSK